MNLNFTERSCIFHYAVLVDNFNHPLSVNNKSRSRSNFGFVNI